MFLFSFLAFGQLRQKIGNNGTNIENCSVLELASTARGFLPPRMTLVQRNNIASPLAGLVVWCTDCLPLGQLEVYNGSSWTNAIGGNPSSSYCGAYLTESGQVIFKIFACYNLGVTDQTVDPHTPSAGILGNYYQWGKKDAVANSSGVIGTWSTTAAPNTAWNDTEKTTNDPCPVGFRVPTKLQWESVLLNNTITNSGSWSSTTNFSSAKHFKPIGSTVITLTLPATGAYQNSSLNNIGLNGYYWSSTFLSTNNSVAYALLLQQNSNSASGLLKNYGFPVRCISE